eukprot:GHVH01012484.1.p1 GENE.GHVH01012484.1~~GHVH01012484.1.p1  ORF type:complete len:277 (-),score=20.49 GHVH01012484.1:421-1251(-)
MSNSHFRGVRGILEAPRPGELVSIDFVGPKVWLGEKFHVACVVDHATRYMFNAVFPGCTAQSAKAALNRYVSIFGVPKAVLCDNGPAFKDAGFTAHVNSVLRSTLVHSSPYYPQGNGINESSHQALSNMISAFNHDVQPPPFAELIRIVTMAYNATPHGRLGSSPHYAMFGSELMLPGWQDLKEYPTQEHRLNALVQERLTRAVQARLREFDSWGVSERRKAVKPGDWVRYKLGEGERYTHVTPTGATVTRKHQPKWSLPCKVEEVKSGSACSGDR